MTDFEFKVKVDTSAGETATTKLTGALDDLTDSAKKAGAAGQAAGKQIGDGLGAAADSTKKTGTEFEGLANRQAAMLERIKKPWRDYAADVNVTMTLLRQGKISTEEYAAEIAKLQAKQEQLARYSRTPQLQAELDMLERLHAPYKRYEEDLGNLNHLMEDARINAAQYDRELERIQKRAESEGVIGKVLGPTRDDFRPSTDDRSAASTANHTHAPLQQVAGVLAKQFGAIGEITETISAGGPLVFAGLTAGAIALTHELMEMHDEWVKLSNSVLSYTDDGRTVNQVIEQQINLSKALHSSLEGTVELHSKLRDLTSEMNLGAGRQAQLAKEIGEAVVATGGSVQQAEGLVQGLALTFSTGVVHGRELNTLFKQFPEIADNITEATGKTRQELYKLANTGQLSAQQLFDAFDKMAPNMERRLKSMSRTFSEEIGHMYDDAKLKISNAGNSLEDFMFPGSAQFKADNRLQQRKDDINKQIKQEQERVERLAPIAAKGNELGIGMGAFPEEQVKAADELRIRMRNVGVVIADSFDAARSKAMLFAAELDELKGSDDAKQIAIDVKRIYDAMNGADNKIQDQVNLWHQLTDQVKIAASVIDKLKASPPVGVPQAVIDQMKREADLDLANAKTAEADAKYGKNITSYAQGLNSAKAELDDWRRAAKDGSVDSEKLRLETDRLLTQLNDGRLPSAIKIWESFTIPIRDLQSDIGGLTSLFESRAISAVRYTDELSKMIDQMVKLHQTELAELAMPDVFKQRITDFANAHVNAFHGMAIAVIDLTDEIKASHDAAVAAQAKEDALLDQQRQRGHADVTRVGNLETLDALSPPPTFAEQTQEKLDNEAKALGSKFVEPLEKYQRALEVITRSTQIAGVTEAEANIERRKARETYDAETQALEKQRGPLQEYEATLRKLNDQLADGAISQRKFADEQNKARIVYLQASDAGKTFAGAFEIQIRQLNESTKDFGVTFAQTAVADMGKFSDALVDAANGGKVSFEDMASSMLQDLEKIALRALEVKAITATFGAIGGGSAAGDAFSLGTSWLPGFATGGSWTVGGSGNGDTQLQMFRATPGERVTVTPVGAYPYGNGGGGAARGGAPSSAAPVVNIHNHYDQSVATAGIDSRNGSKTVLNVLRANSSATRSFLGIRR